MDLAAMLLFVMQLILGYVKAQPVVSPSGTVNVIEGRNFTLTCSYEKISTEESSLCRWDEFVNQTVTPLVKLYLMYEDGECTKIYGNDSLYGYTCLGNNKYEMTIYNARYDVNHNSKWRCTQYHNNLLVDSTYVTINVRVGITDVVLFPDGDPINVIENSETSLLCRTSGGLPGAAVRWFIQRSGQVKDLTSLSIGTYQEAGHLNVTLSTLNYTAVKFDHTGQIYCSANNVGEESISAKRYLNVLYGPISRNLQNVSKVHGENFVYQCLYLPGNPPTVDFEWTRSGTGVAWVKQNTPNLTIPNVQRSDETTYTCNVSSVLRPTTTIQYDTATFHLNVFYGAEHLVLQLNNISNASVEIEEHSSNHMRCLLESDPGSDMALTKDGKTIITRSGVHQLTHDLQAECSDAGVYTCTGYNQYGAADNASLHLFVKCSARPSAGVTVQLNFTARQHENATLFYKIVAYPVPKPSQFVWKRCTNRSSCDLLPEDFNKFKINTVRLSSNLTVLDVQIEDYGMYQLSVSNGVGDKLVEWFQLRPVEKPDSPTDFHVIQSTIKMTTAVVTWIPGFDGGSPQEFHISYGKLVDDSGYFNKVVKHDYTKMMYYTLEDLEPGTEHFVSIFAANEEGSTDSINDTFQTLGRLYDPNETNLSNVPVVGGAIGGTVGAIIAVVVAFVILRRKYSLNINVSLSRKSADPDAKPVSGTDNPGFKAAHTYEELSMITVSSVYDELKNDDNG
ncbi:nephrin-like [Mya arenaria]|uniref:nephrin-like n=1 Tax=Mya arenaria TaxID=6604 RepID=UPI0022E7130C|nr:nephrin-like [Mya arenaria]